MQNFSGYSVAAADMCAPSSKAIPSFERQKEVQWHLCLSLLTDFIFKVIKVGIEVKKGFLSSLKPDTHQKESPPIRKRPRKRGQISQFCATKRPQEQTTHTH